MTRCAIFILCVITLLTPDFFPATRAQRIKRLAGGQDAKSHEFPYQVSLRYYNVHICGGALVSQRHILSAAHCVCGLIETPYEELTVVTGSDKITAGEGETHHVKNIDCHPDYKYGVQNSWMNDIVVITLSENVTTSSVQSPISLSTSDVPSNAKMILSGWGKRGTNTHLSTNLQKLSVTTINNKECQKKYKTPILNWQLCTFEGNGIGACKGDSGSPLVYNGKLVGIFSWTIPCGIGIPDVYTKIYSFLDFIKEKMNA